MALLPSGVPTFSPGGDPASWVIAGSIVEVTGGRVGFGVAVGGSFGFLVGGTLVGVGEADGVGEGEGVAVTVGGVEVGDGVGETAGVLVGVALGSSTTSGTTAAPESVV